MTSQKNGVNGNKQLRINYHFVRFFFLFFLFHKLAKLISGNLLTEREKEKSRAREPWFRTRAGIFNLPHYFFVVIAAKPNGSKWYFRKEPSQVRFCIKVFDLKKKKEERKKRIILHRGIDKCIIRIFLCVYIPSDLIDSWIVNSVTLCKRER